MALTQLDKTYSDIQREVALALGWPRNSGQWGTVRSDDFRAILDAGLNQFYYPPPLPGESTSHDWSFLHPFATIELNASFSTGTIDADGELGIVTNTSSWPSWAAQGDLWVTESGTTTRYEVHSRESSSELLLEDTSSASSFSSSNVTSWALRRHYYDLPDDFGGMYSDGFTYRRDEEKWRGMRIQRRGEAFVRELDWEWDTNYPPQYFALVPNYDKGTSTTTIDGNTVDHTHTSRQTWKALFGPGLIEEGTVLEYRYNAQPPSLDGTAVTYTYGGTMHTETIIASVIDKAFQRIYQNDSKHQRFMAHLQQSVVRDRARFQEKNLGRGDWQDGPIPDGMTLREYRQYTPYENINLSFSN